MKTRHVICVVYRKKLKSLFDKTAESQVMQIEKNLMSFNPLSFEIIEDHLAHVKELQLILGDCRKDFPKKHDYLIELIWINMKIPYDVFYSKFYASW
jgi:hypothetical protein